MIRGNIAIVDKDPKSWRSRSRKREPAADIPIIIEGVKIAGGDQAGEAHPAAARAEGVE
jgi:hypothetical protein